MSSVGKILGEKRADMEQRSRSYDPAVNGYIVSRVQNESATQLANSEYARKHASSEATVKINLPKTMNKDNEKISTGLMMMTTTSSADAASSSKINSKMASPNNTLRAEKKQGSFKKV